MTPNPFDSDPLEPPPQGFQPSAAAPPPTAPQAPGQPYPEPSDPYGQPPPDGGPDRGGAAHGGPRRTNSLAVVALVCGVMSFVCVPLVTSTIAIVQGGNAQKRIAQSGEAGAGMAKAGRIVGIVGLVLSVAEIGYLVIGALIDQINIFEAFFLGAILIGVLLIGPLGQVMLMLNLS